MEVTPEGLLLTEYNPEFTVEEIQAVTEAQPSSLLSSRAWCKAYRRMAQQDIIPK